MLSKDQTQELHEKLFDLTRQNGIALGVRTCVQIAKLVLRASRTAIERADMDDVLVQDFEEVEGVLYDLYGIEEDD